MLSRAITPKRRGRRPLIAVALVTVIVGLLAAYGTVLAVHDEDFQLDGDLFDTTPAPVPAGSTSLPAKRKRRRLPSSAISPCRHPTNGPWRTTAR